MSDDDNDDPIESNKEALDEIGKQFDVTRERIRQIEEKALKNFVLIRKPNKMIFIVPFAANHSTR